MEPGPGKKNALKDCVQAALDVVRAGRKEEAAVLLYRCAYRLIFNRLKFGNGTTVVGMTEADAEDNIYPTIERFVNSKPNGSAGGLNWLYRVIDSQAWDFHRRADAQKRRGDRDVEPLYNDDGEVRPEVDQAAPDFDAAVSQLRLDDCMEGATKEFEQDYPAFGRVLRLVKEGYDNDDLAVAYGADPKNITETQRKNIRQRKSHALKQAREYFEHCKE